MRRPIVASALPGADFVVTSVALDRIATWRVDHDLALRHGFASVLSENGGPGGLSHTLRSVPLMLEIGQDVEELAPSALILNYTNPENRVCLALRRHTAHAHRRAVSQRRGGDRRCARTLGRSRAEIDVHAAGAEHFTWFLSVRDARDGRDLMPEFRRRRLADDRTKRPARRMLVERLGLHPAIDDGPLGEYLPGRPRSSARRLRLRAARSTEPAPTSRCSRPGVGRPAGRAAPHRAIAGSEDRPQRGRDHRRPRSRVGPGADRRSSCQRRLRRQPSGDSVVEVPGSSRRRAAGRVRVSRSRSRRWSGTSSPSRTRRSRRRSRVARPRDAGAAPRSRSSAAPARPSGSSTRS